MRHHPHIARHKNLFYALGLINFLFSLHTAIPAYVSSSYLSLFTSSDRIGAIYMAGAMVTVLALFLVYRVLKRFGDYRTALGLIVLDALAMAGLVWGHSFAIISLSFVLYLAVVALMGFTYDVFLETYTDVAHTGSVRGWFMTISNAAWILSPLAAGMLITDHMYGRVYVAALALLVPVFYLIHRNFPRFPDPSYESPSPWKTLGELMRMPDIWKLSVINIVLNTFYAWMIIYTPLYLANVVGFDWASIGLILTVMLVPFVLIQIPFGRLADEKHGEKELMGIGFAIMSVTTVALAFIHAPSVIVWAGALFMTRIGAALAEVMIETYFFKKVPPKDSNILSAFRATRQIPYFLAPAITGLGLYFTSFTGLFIVLGTMCLLPLVLIASMQDIKPEPLEGPGILPRSR